MLFLYIWNKLNTQDSDSQGTCPQLALPLSQAEPQSHPRKLGDNQLSQTNLVFPFSLLPVFLNGVYLFTRATATKYHKRGSLKTEIHCVTVLEPGSLKSRCRQDHPPPRGGEARLCSRPSPWLVDGHLPASVYNLFLLCVTVSYSPLLFKDTSHIKLRPNLMTLIFISYPLKNLSPNRVTFWNTGG